VFLCGPPPMVDTLETTLKELGYPEQAVILP
jgi:ferredoxin-NADP reductase